MFNVDQPLIAAEPGHEARLRLALRKCQMACDLLNWTDARNWFQSELNRYQAPTPVPEYRVIRGELVWRRLGAKRQAESLLRNSMLGRPDTEQEAEQQTIQFEVRFALDQIEQLAENKGSSQFEFHHDLPTAERTVRRSWRLALPRG